MAVTELFSVDQKLSEVNTLECEGVCDIEV